MPPILAKNTAIPITSTNVPMMYNHSFVVILIAPWVILRDDDISVVSTVETALDSKCVEAPYLF